VYLSEYTTKADWDKWGEEMGLDKPIFVQYVTWLGKAATGEFGTSLRDQIDAFDVIKARIPATLQLSGGALLFATIVGVPLGVLSAVRRGSFWDYAARIFSLGGQSIPGFWLGIMLILLFAVQLDLLPTGRRGGIDHYILPSIALGWSSSAGFTRLIRSAMLQILDSEYIVFARAKGVNSRVIIWKHAFKNAVIVPLTFSGLLVASYITGTVVTETVFAWPGLGRLAVDAVFNNDFPVVTGVVLIFTLIYVGINLFVDIAYAVIDPRIRY
jgi:peptide/nickel transport system permease protein